MDRDKLELETVDIYGIQLDVYYECEVLRDPYGTGDSPTQYEITIHSVEPIDSVVDIEELLSKHCFDAIEEQLIAIEASRNE